MYLLSYFTEWEEAMFVAVSNDGFSWDPLNDGKPIHYSTVGNHCIRDPFLLQDDKGLYHAIWTDGWESRSIGYASSTNLIDWEDERLLPVMEGVAGTRNCWAPEMFWDSAHNAYRIIWSSTVALEGERVRDHRIWSVLTEDFKSVSEPELFFDPGYNVIDATVIDTGDLYLMVYKDERGQNIPETDNKALRACYFTKTKSPTFTEPSALLTPALTEGPTLYPLELDGKDGWMMLFDHFQEHKYGALYTYDFSNWTQPKKALQLPTGLRHASVIRTLQR